MTHCLFACTLTLGTLVACGLAYSQTTDSASAEVPAASLPGRVDLRPELDKWGLGPRAQRDRPTCSVFTTAAAMELELARHLGKGQELSIEYLNWAANNSGRGRWGRREPGDGQFFFRCQRGFERWGICPEEDMPYREKFDPEIQPAPEVIEKATAMLDVGFQFTWIKPLWPRHAGLTEEQFTQVKQALAAGHAVAIGSSHSRLYVGYRDDERRPGGGMFYTKDSGAGRYRRVSYEWTRNNVNDAFWVGIAPKDTKETAAAE